MMEQVLFFDFFFKKYLLLNAVESQRKSMKKIKAGYLMTPK